VGQSLSHSQFSDDQSLDGRSEELRFDFLQKLLARLKERGILTDHLAGHSDDREPALGWERKGTYYQSVAGAKIIKKRSSKSSYMGVGVDLTIQPLEKRLHRRVDIKVYSPSQLPFALLYFTGSDLFNRSMRLYAKKIRGPDLRFGYTLNDKGLFPKLGYYPNSGETINGPCVPGLCSERDVMEFLRLDWIEPHERTAGVAELSGVILANGHGNGNGESDRAGAGAGAGVINIDVDDVDDVDDDDDDDLDDDDDVSICDSET
jgi:hypothetical protein